MLVCKNISVFIGILMGIFLTASLSPRVFYTSDLDPGRSLYLLVDLACDQWELLQSFVFL